MVFDAVPDAVRLTMAIPSALFPYTLLAMVVSTFGGFHKYIQFTATFTAERGGGI